jgi:iron complex outermembrane receptor protein
MQTFFYRLLLVGLGLLLPVWAHAQETTLEEIVVEADMSDASPEAPSSYTTVIRPEALHAQFRSLTDLVAQTAGVNVQSTGGLGQFSTMTIRGSTPEQVAVYMDGIRLTSGATGVVDLSTIPIDSIDRIEVIRGGGTAQFGQDAIGGVLNIITKHARRGAQASAYVGGGYFQTLKAGASLSKQTPSHSGIVSLEHVMTKGDYHFKAATTTLSGASTGVGGETFERIHNRSLSDSVLAKGDLRLGDKWFLQGSNNFFWTTRQMPGTEEQTTLLYPANPLDAQERYWRELASLQATCSDCGIDHLFFQPAASVQYEWRHFRDASPAVGSPIDHAVRYLAVNPNFSTGYSWDLAGSHESRLRMDYRLERQTDSVGNSTTVPIGTQTRNVGMVMIQDKWSSLRDRLTVLPVVRYEAATAFAHNLGLKLGVSGKPVRLLTLKGNVEYGYRLPNFDELYFPDEGFLRGNPNLAKEKSLNMDAGLILQSEKARLEAAYFFNRIENSIIFVPISALTIQPINTFEVHIHGVEAIGRLRIARDFLLEGNYTWTRARFVSTRDQLPGRPDQIGNVHIGWEHKWGKHWKLALFSDVRMVSRIPVNVQNTVFISSKTQVDAGLSATLWRRWNITVEGKDLTDAQQYDVRAFPLPRRSVFATVKYDWESGEST